MSKSVAILYQAQEPPAVDGIKKPMKPGGYSDSGTNIAYSLHQQGIEVEEIKDLVFFVQKKVEKNK
ncbi:hypothetical protein [Epilithonimonas lactis]|uniref:Uncharacterized protein n=1 Tax=Epilithonimonas lactis TaxID=421072 RepID=A0A085B6W8_9FLAO|nr:hypothetical protein [Epilithonimonas lactis]KFC18213.1 hypothetical protein IO89_18990 [Epilithonimonas lactis]SER08311.1 hypothetical protein SAMN04488097_3835 [Epilithonimonas lactis]